MQLAMIGLGRMGGNMVRRLAQGGHEVVVYDQNADAGKATAAIGAKATKYIADVARQLSPRRVVWVMVPAGDPVESTLEQLMPHLTRGDIVIEGGNSNFRDSLRRAETLKVRGIEFMDAGTSGGIWGLELGYCLMIGASESAFRHCEPIFKTLAPPDGYAHVGPPGAGGYVEDSGEGRWTVEEAIRLDVPAPVITASLFARLRSRQEESFGAKVIAALRKEFGGHSVHTK